MRAQLGLAAPDVELKVGVTCPKCDSMSTLYEQAGKGWVECVACPVLLSTDEYERWVGLAVTNLVHLRGVACPACRREQMFSVRGTDRVRCGWCEHHELLAA